jgi:hypothetical protein
MKKKYVIKIKQPNETSMTMKKNGEREKKDHHHISIVNEKRWMDEGGATFAQRCVHSCFICMYE